MKTTPTRNILAFAIGFSILLSCNPAFGQGDKSHSLMIFAAASTTTVMTQLADLFSKNEGIKTRTSFAASSSLAKQIQSGAPADIFLSANIKWMDYLEQKGLIVASSRFNLLGNRIVLISPALDPVPRFTISRSTDLIKLMKNGRLAMGDPDHVPAGIYGRKALENLGLYSGVERSVARAKDVRAALFLVEKGEAPLGIVYQTDAAISSKIVVSSIFPEKTHPPICYPVAVVAGQESKAAQKFIRFLKSKQVKQIFQTHGFSVY